ncbi:WxL domain-containing protein [Levilactobacillus suantsaii]|uniref:WxL domain-containing protein n=1 Tax=Levilactobacillus suantsaii TaxID=2292255 RepID=A0A4Q0VH83_9LACO|nr:WxL domain-containing protein [Levilactobacillus suantsaii]QMU08890.1 WxL domain-containing protein [Levilactobacillus suantsaii]RXI76149.1 WxL domain-containing protein [Levilactobacillus suantsaii]
MKRRVYVTLMRSAAALALGLSGAGMVAFADATSSSSSSSSVQTTTSTQAKSEFDTSADAAVSLTSAPNFGFGANPTPNGKDNVTYPALSADNPVEVSNPGVPGGWNVQVKDSNFVTSDGSVLGGAVLNLGAPDPEAANTGNPSAAPVANAVSLNGNGTNEVLLTAPAKGGLGVWDSDFSLGDVTLDVPAGQLAGSYSANLTWQLGDTVQ